MKHLKFPDIFPDDRVYDAYNNPTVDKSEERFEFGEINTEELKKFAASKMGWSYDKTDETLLPLLSRIEKFSKEQQMMEDFVVRNEKRSTKNVTKNIESKRMRKAVQSLKETKNAKEKENKENTQKKRTKNSDEKKSKKRKIK